MREIKYYEAIDGALFSSIEACEEHERNAKEKIINDFIGLIVRQAEGSTITKDASAFPLSSVDECWGYAAIVMKNENDYLKVKRFAKSCKNPGTRIEKIYNEEILVGIGDVGRGEYLFNWFYWYGTVNEAIQNYTKALTTFNK